MPNHRKYCQILSAWIRFFGQHDKKLHNFQYNTPDSCLCADNRLSKQSTRFRIIQCRRQKQEHASTQPTPVKRHNCQDIERQTSSSEIAHTNDCLRHSTTHRHLALVTQYCLPTERPIKLISIQHLFTKSIGVKQLTKQSQDVYT